MEDIIQLGDHKFEVIATTEYKFYEYAAIMEYFENEEDAPEEAELLIMKVVRQKDGVYFETISNDEDFETLARIFQKSLDL